jgi:hypothetical protein
MKGIIVVIGEKTATVVIVEDIKTVCLLDRKPKIGFAVLHDIPKDSQSFCMPLRIRSSFVTGRIKRFSLSDSQTFRFARKSIGSPIGKMLRLSKC